jgi:hypothetical protein
MERMERAMAMAMAMAMAIAMVAVWMRGVVRAGTKRGVTTACENAVKMVDIGQDGAHTCSI